jgi:hypothetical protein
MIKKKLENYSRKSVAYSVGVLSLRKIHLQREEEEVSLVDCLEEEEEKQMPQAVVRMKVIKKCKNNWKKLDI